MYVITSALTTKAACLQLAGWLDQDHEYARGEISESDFIHLERLLQGPFQPVMSMGLHECNICQFSGPQGVKNLFVPHNGDILVAPELITHYINCHGYVPPDRFIQAIRGLDSSRNMAYKKCLLENNGQFLLPNKES